METRMPIGGFFALKNPSMKGDYRMQRN